MVRPFVDRPITDVGAAEELAATAARDWGLAPPTLLRRGMNAIYRCGPIVVRVGTPTVDPVAGLELADVLGSHGLAVARPVRSSAIEAGGLSATAWEYLEPIDEPIDWRAVGAMVRTTHRIERDSVPTAYPLPTPPDFPWWDFGSLLGVVGHLIDDDARRGLNDAIARWPDWADGAGAVICHGDVHPGNVVMTETGPALIDWDLLCWAPPGWDHAPLMTWATRWGGESAWYREFSRGYGASMTGKRSAEAFAELRLVAATLMRLKASMTDEAALPEAERRLRYWRGETNAPMWQAQ